MSKLVAIEPVTRIEGHGKVTIQLDNKGRVADCQFNVIEFRGFEKFCEGRMLWEMPLIVPRICGICSISHHLASVKACEDLLKVKPPRAAGKLRELMYMGQIIHSHAEHFFILAAPDYVVGPDAKPAIRNILGIIKANPKIAKKALQIRRIGGMLVEKIGGRAIHPVSIIPGGVSKPLSHEDRYILRKEIDKAIPLAEETVGVAKKLAKKYADLIPLLGVLDTNYLGLVKDGNLSFVGDKLRLSDWKGKVKVEFEPRKYLNYLGEHVKDFSYMKFPYYQKDGWPKGIYRVGPLARLNVADRAGTPLADKELKEFKKLGKGLPVKENFYYHYARAIEILYACERAKELLQDDEIVSDKVRVKASRRGGEGVGVVEAPRGTLIHHYWADEIGKIKKVNLIVATVNNNGAINLSVKEVARNFIKKEKLDEGVLNRIEMTVRCFDPCLSCATHEIRKKVIENK